MNGPGPTSVFLVSMVLWMPALRTMLRGDLDLAGAAVRYGIALAVAYTGMSVVVRVVAGYRMGLVQRHLEAEPRRRRTD